MAARLTKPIRWRKIFVALQACSLAGLAASAPLPLSHTDQLRDCVARAQGAAAVAACEKQQQTALKARIEQLSETIRARLDARQRLAFDRNMSAWQAFFDSERALLDLTLGLRRDGLGPSLHAGAITRIYEQREQQLREHLHNLSITPPTSATGGRRP